MRILLTGANGFIGGAILAKLLTMPQHQITCAVRDTFTFTRRYPNLKVIGCDYLHDTDISLWASRLIDIDVIINCVGVLQPKTDDDAWKIHYHTPKALTAAAVQLGTKKIIHISALGIETNIISYASSKKAYDDYLKEQPITSVTLRPSLIYGEGSYGGTSYFRGLAGLPKFIPLPDGGKQLFQPVFLDDLAGIAAALVDKTSVPKLQLDVVGPEQLSLADIVQRIRAWLGLPPAKIISIPSCIAKFCCKIGDFIGNKVMNSTSYSMLMQNNITTSKESAFFLVNTPLIPLTMSAALQRIPSHVQDQWHAKLYFLKPLLRIALGLFWLWSGLVCLFFAPGAVHQFLSAHQVSPSFQNAIIIIGGLIDSILGTMTLFKIKLARVLQTQLIVMLGYLMGGSLFFPQLWLDPFAALSKILPLFVATLMLLALEIER
jgi:uncharacterized protein YbjT (DUF2867 family)